MAFKCIQNAFVRKVLRAVECHVLKEVGEAVLVILLQDGSNVLDDVVAGPAGRLRVVTDVIGKAVVEFSDAEIRIRGHCSIHGALCCCSDGNKCNKKQRN